MRKILKIISVSLILAISLALLAGCGGSQEKKIVIGSKNFTENMVLGEIFAQVIQDKTDLKVEYKENLGGTMVCFEAIKKGDLDIYPEYTGTGLTAHLKMDVINDADRVYDIVQEEFNKQFKIKWLKPLGFNNTYAVAVKEDYAKENNITKVSELVPLAKDLTFGGEHEFFDRQDGYEGMIETYGLNFKSAPAKMDVALKYQAISQGKMDVTDAFATDGQLITYKLTILEDDKNFFPPYYAAPIVRNDTLEKYPELEEVLNSLAGKISDEEMQMMNYKVESEKKAIRDVARDFLTEKGLLSK
ncbi:osmoprotectant transport system substrate-binding protein [Anaerobacterium chartisolvens]|uniref:Osmoprotectant transport system substrate-binding protein n=1 Tax=Anaerobacterium chartisolvens TaxID=1297424 RepID=A0A369BIJ0_9FIRM|nr:glycine betaine ABC transporter substrate-binding protein [Anaerobacterium chartisolvens]RCX20995.1 osmoprotectant transport system substrate-binding protein [Anaerobacterium chartisolvens]